MSQQGHIRAGSKSAEELLEGVAAELEIPDSRYEAAERSYRSVAKWMERPESSLLRFRPEIYPQGSFRLGTVTKPVNDEEHYDLDVVCSLHVKKATVTQHRLKELLGAEIRSYAVAQGMAKPGESRRCWTLEYADGAQFHMDLLPALPDGQRQRLLLESRGFDSAWSSTALAITDVDHHAFRVIGDDWPSSNPKGYGDWFIGRMRSVFEARRSALALALRESAENIPDYKVKTPLQQAIQVLKRHRDLTFIQRAEDKPISVILTTLAARSYRGETTISGALYGILEGMEAHIEDREGVFWIPNPTDPRENFADRWEEFPERRDAFHEWLGTARHDFASAAAAVDGKEAISALTPRLGKRLVEAAAGRRPNRQGTEIAKSGNILVQSAASRMAGKLSSIIGASHRKAPVWPDYAAGVVRIKNASFTSNGFRPRTFSSDGPALSKGSNLIFEAATNIAAPYKIYWQITNTGRDAVAAKGLRGGFEEGAINSGMLTRRETTSYSGSHGIECFIVKNGYMAARSGVFVVNIGSR